MSAQPEALRLADLLDAHQFDEPHAAAAELRRLHEESDLLASAADKLRALYREERTELLRQRDQATAQRDALLEALQEALEVCIWPNAQVSGVEEKARAAISAVEETK